jgi:triosephosphate isomerase
VAYEPIWAIGAKDAMLPEDIYEMSLFVKKVLADMYGYDEAVSTPVLYGGAVNFRNAVDIFVKGKVDGLLVGRESVNISGFIDLLKVADSI